MVEISDKTIPQAVKRTMILKCKLSNEELAQIAEKISTKRIRMEEIKAEVSDLNGTKKDLDDAVIQLSHQVREGEGEKPIICDVVYNYPCDGKKTIKRLDKKTDNIWEENMTEEESSSLFPPADEVLTTDKADTEGTKALPAHTDDSYEVVDDEANADERPDDKPKTEYDTLKEIKDAYGFDPTTFGDEYFIASSEKTLADHNIDSANFSFCDGCLLVKANFNVIKVLLDDTLKPAKVFRIDKANAWYVFNPKVAEE